MLVQAGRQQLQGRVAVQVVAVGHPVGAVEHLGTRTDRVGGSPGSVPRWAGQILADRHHFEAGDVAVGGLEHPLFHFGPGDQNEALDAGALGLGGGDGEDRLVVRADRLQLLGPAEAAAQPAGEEDE